jgi:hypothetical protein
MDWLAKLPDRFFPILCQSAPFHAQCDTQGDRESAFVYAHSCLNQVFFPLVIDLILNYAGASRRLYLRG